MIITTPFIDIFGDDIEIKVEGNKISDLGAVYFSFPSTVDYKNVFQLADIYKIKFNSDYESFYIDEDSKENRAKMIQFIIEANLLLSLKIEKGEIKL